MNPSVKNYLVAYNFVAFACWATYLVFFLGAGLELTNFNLLLLNIAQGIALLEIVHALLKWVKSPIASTFVQVFSRILVLVFINIFLPDYADLFIFRAGVMIVSVAWGITELLRYSLYFCSLFDKHIAAIIWMRYSFFIVLYPMGVTGEWFILLAPTAANGFTIGGYSIFLALCLFAYIYYFPVLYKYMWKQRKSKITA